MNLQRTPRGDWHKSSYSLNEDACCVEVADFATAVGVRDSKNLGPVARLAPDGWAGFVTVVKAGELGR
ncbi:DUF397 domain-containing protein [Streptomyces sp. NBC_00183]|uniref:DUF397 domain-containing protein n=1 Tax=unclassified Streptomyces TaxID=2593676 RepID=UPI002257D305|nr:DUF397 domain-containing protein [Streptomyces sp. NBC_00183]MCX5291360.1 DUF397 domain-containing protein [Streptomyces sp. NBC_00183]